MQSLQWSCAPTAYVLKFNWFLLQYLDWTQICCVAVFKLAKKNKNVNTRINVDIPCKTLSISRRNSLWRQRNLLYIHQTTLWELAKEAHLHRRGSHFQLNECNGSIKIHSNLTQPSRHLHLFAFSTTYYLYFLFVDRTKVFCCLFFFCPKAWLLCGSGSLSLELVSTDTWFLCISAFP